MQQSLLGIDSFFNLREILKKYNAKSIFLIRSKDSYERCGAKSKFDTIINELDFKIEEFCDFSINPKIEDVEKGLGILMSLKSSIIIAIGGGSVLDMAKLIRFFNSFHGEIKSSFFTQTHKLIPLITIPTTAGSGSEATHFAVVYKDKIKYSVAHPDILADIAIVDPTFTYNLPPYITACTGFDALSQAIEAFWNVNASEESDYYAEKAINLLWDNLPLVVKDSNHIEARNAICEGAHFAGNAINITKTTAPHAFSYPFTTFYGYPHGHAVALTFPFFMQLNFCTSHEQLNSKLKIERHHEKMKRLFGLLRIRNEFCATEIMKEYITSLGLSFNLPENFDLELITKNINAQRIANNPCVIDEQLARRVIMNLKMKP